MGNKEKFLSLEHEWGTVRIGFIRDLSQDSKNDIERIYKEEIDQNWLPNEWCKACYFDAIRRLIIKFGV
jgi:hypothetical protein